VAEKANSNKKTRAFIVSILALILALIALSAAIFSAADDTGKGLSGTTVDPKADAATLIKNLNEVSKEGKISGSALIISDVKTENGAFASAKKIADKLSDYGGLSKNYPHCYISGDISYYIGSIEYIETGRHSFCPKMTIKMLQGHETDLPYTEILYPNAPDPDNVPLFIEPVTEEKFYEILKDYLNDYAKKGLVTESYRKPDNPFNPDHDPKNPKTLYVPIDGGQWDDESFDKVKKEIQIFVKKLNLRDYYKIDYWQGYRSGSSYFIIYTQAEGDPFIGYDAIGTIEFDTYYDDEVSLPYDEIQFIPESRYKDLEFEKKYKR
jgi:hypothetical protein